MTAIPPSLKIITSFLRRAEELEKDSNRDAQVVSYYCRLYAVSKAAKLGNTSDPEISKFLVSQMDILEQAKGSVGTSLPQGKDICLRYAETLFTKADEVDRLGAADKAIAKLFYSVGTIYDIMDQFGDVEEEVINETATLLSSISQSLLLYNRF